MAAVCVCVCILSGLAKEMAEFYCGPDFFSPVSFVCSLHV